MDKKWTELKNYVELGRKMDISVQSLGTSVLLKDVFFKQTAGVDAALHDCNESGNIEDLKTTEKVREYLEEKGGKMVYQFHGAGFNSYMWLWDEGIAELEISGKTYMSITAQSEKKEFITELRAFLKPLFKPAISQGHVFAIVSQGGRLALNSIGNAGIPVVRRNYSPEVMESYDFVIKDLNSSTPSGRIVIMEGEPGTGKTHLVRAMLMDVPDGMFVLVSPDMVTHLGGPELLPLLLSHRHNQNGPIILILEDADRCLVTRQGDNINSIQSLLNLGDGILGSLLDLRIVATTNAKKLEMEQAILRPGRLSRRLEVGSLDLSTARGVFTALCPEAEMPAQLLGSKKATLAEVYSLARKAGWEPESRKKDAALEEDEGDPRPEAYDDDEEDDYN
jgi:hypothetical protein